MEKALEKIRGNWKEIRAEGKELMGIAGMWKEDPGFNSIPGARGWWVDILLREKQFPLKVGRGGREGGGSAFSFRTGCNV